MRQYALILFSSWALMAGSVTNERIISLIKAKTPESEIKDMIRREGLAFAPNASTQSEIREAGGEVSLTSFIYTFGMEHGGAARPLGRSSEAKASSEPASWSIRTFAFGIHGGISVPLADLKDTVDGKSAATYGVHVDIPVSSNVLIRPRVDVANYTGRYAVLEAQFPGLTTASTIKTLWAGAEWVLGQGAIQDGGWYGGIGLGVQNTSVKVDMVNLPKANIDDSKSAVASSLLVGYQFTEHVGAELRFSSSTPKITVGSLSADFKGQAVSASVTCRF